MVDDIERSRWLIFVQRGVCPDKHTDACLLGKVSTFEGSPYLRIIVRDRDRHPDGVIALVGHELQHALEFARARNVERTEDLVALFRRIGKATSHRETCWSYETRAAALTGARVLDELRRHRRD
jgi:hypothetical protein